MTAEDTCPRCCGAFHCGVADAAPCACSTVALSTSTLAELRERYEVCVCLACLVELAALDKSAHEKAGPVSRPAGLRD